MPESITRRTFLTTTVAGSFGIVSLLNSHNSLAKGDSANFDDIRSQIKKAVQGSSPASIAVAVSKGGNIVWEEAFGWANRERRIPATINTRYAISSASKPFTATAIMTLVERGLIKLDEPLSKYLGGMRLTAYVGDASSVTVRHLLQHTSGLPRHWRNFYSDENELAPKLQETIQRYGILTSVPGKQYNYSNLGYALIAHIIEQVSGLPFAEFMRREVFLPLGLSDTTIENDRRLSRPAAVFYGGGGTVEPYYTVDESGSQRVFSTARDLLKFGMFHLKERPPGQKQIIQPSAIDRMARERQTMGDIGGSDSFNALGWVGHEKSAYGYYKLAHSGDAPGVSAQLMILPDEHIAIATIANTRFADLIYTVADEVLDALLPDNKKMRESDPAEKPPTAAQPFKPNEELVGRWMGEIKTYSGTIPAAMTFQPDGDVHLKLEGQLETLVNNLRFENGRIIGRCQGTITTEDALRRPHQLRLVLLQEGGILSGTVHAQSSIDSQAKGSPKRDYFALASWIELTKRA